jgi:16S rRNA (uracil1498-N3)-methyltransferase
VPIVSHGSFIAKTVACAAVNLLLLEPDELAGDRATLRDRRARHLVEVLRVAPGQRLRAGVIGGPLGEAEVLAVDVGAVTVRLTTAGAAPTPAPIDLVLAVPRPKVLTRVLEHAAAWSVRRVELVNAWRVDKSYLGSSRLAAAAVAGALRRGAEQGMTTHLPGVAVHRRLMAYLDDALPAAAPAGAQRLIADARQGALLEAAVPPGDRRPVLVAIGPEGGWIGRELDSFTARGFTVVRLGGAVLRVEAAVTAALAQLALLARLPPP